MGQSLEKRYVWMDDTSERTVRLRSGEAKMIIDGIDQLRWEAVSPPRRKALRRASVLTWGGIGVKAQAPRQWYATALGSGRNTVDVCIKNLLHRSSAAVSDSGLEADTSNAGGVDDQNLGLAISHVRYDRAMT